MEVISSITKKKSQVKAKIEEILSSVKQIYESCQNKMEQSEAEIKA